MLMKSLFDGGAGGASLIQAVVVFISSFRSIDQVLLIQSQKENVLVGMVVKRPQLLG